MRKAIFLALLPLVLWADAHMFVYHRFGDPQHASTNTSIETLRAEFEYFKKHGYKVVSLATVAKAYQKNLPIDPKWVILTIDDAYKSFFENALPLFREYHYPFTLFVYVEATDQGYGDFMNWEQLKEAGKYGEIALHSYGHHHMVSLSEKAIYEDTQQGYNRFKKHMGYPPKYYAYPYGEYNKKVRNTIASFGFDLILNQNSGAIDKQSDPHDLDRTALTGQNTVAQKLKIQTLPTLWHTPQKWPKGGKLKKIHATIPKTISHVEYYVTGYGWKRTKAVDGEIYITTDLQLKRSRTRVLLKHGHRQSSIILVKE